MGGTYPAGFVGFNRIEVSKVNFIAIFRWRIIMKSYLFFSVSELVVAAGIESAVT